MAVASPFQLPPSRTPLLRELRLERSVSLRSDAALAHLTGLTKLYLTEGVVLLATAAGFKHLGRLKSLAIRGRQTITDAAFTHLSCLEELDISYRGSITAAAFIHFTKLHTLRMANCGQEGICDESFSHLTRLTKLDMSYCQQPTITASAFSHLGKLVELTLAGVEREQRAVVASGFKYLTSLRHLFCHSVQFNWDVLAPLAGLQSLTLSTELLEGPWGSPPTSLDNLLELRLYQVRDTLQLTDAVLQGMTCLTSLYVQGAGLLSDAAFTGCGKLLELNLGYEEWREECSISDSACAHLTALTRLELRECSGAITETAFRHLSALQALVCCHNPAVTDAWTCQLSCLRELDMAGCGQEAITDAAFRHLSLLEVLDISRCRQSTITDAAFAHLPSLTKLDMTGCSQECITPAVAGYLSHVAIVDCRKCSAEVQAALQLHPPHA